MPSERMQRQIDRLLDEAEAAAASGEWAKLRDLAGRVLTLDPDNEDAPTFLAAAERGLAAAATDVPASEPMGAPSAPPASITDAEAERSFGAGRYVVQSVLGQGG